MPTIVQQSRELPCNFHATLNSQYFHTIERIRLDEDSRLRYTALIPILHGYYPTSGELNLLTAAEELARFCINLCILANTCQPPVLRIQLACILLDNCSRDVYWC
jgi:hypothetical protein